MNFLVGKTIERVTHNNDEFDQHESINLYFTDGTVCTLQTNGGEDWSTISLQQD